MSDVQTIKDRIDIVQLIQEYAPLKKAGVNWKACCPFHQEKTPSFMVHPERQFFHCFGCGKSGDIFNFIQEMEGMDFPEALRLLAERAGVKIDAFRSEIDKSQKNRILDINARAAVFFHNFLLQMPNARKARDYLAGRGLTSQTIADWQIGYAPDQWDLLTKYLLKKGCGIDDVAQAGLVVKKDSANAATGRGYYDRFRGRIMFPIWSTHGDIVGFTGRILVETENSGGKYVNTPQTLVFDKSRLLYGLNKAKQEIKSKDTTVLAEGQMDVISCHQAGMKNVVAASGTALTIEQVRLLQRYSNNIVMAFDDDEAGRKAAKRGVDIALEQGMNVKIIQIPENCGKDADECIKKDKDSWFKAVENAQNILDWYLFINFKDLDPDNPKAKQLAAENILAEIARLPHAIERDYWLRKLSSKIDIDVGTLKEEMKQLAKRFPIAPDRSSGAITSTLTNLAPKNRHLLDLENIWSIFFKHKPLFTKYGGRMVKEYFANTWLLDIYEIAQKQYNKDSGLDMEKLEGLLSSDFKQKVVVLVLKGEQYFGNLSEKEAERELVLILGRIEIEAKKKQLQKQIVK